MKPSDCFSALVEIAEIDARKKQAAARMAELADDIALLDERRGALSAYVVRQVRTQSECKLIDDRRGGVWSIASGQVQAVETVDVGTIDRGIVLGDQVATAVDDGPRVKQFEAVA